MNIVFDLDDTITRETEFMLKYAPKYLKKKYKIDAIVKNPNGYNVAEVFGLKEIFNTGSLTEEEIEKKCMEAINGFWNGINYIKYMFYPLKEDVVESINTLKEQGDNIYLLSTRGKKTKENDTKLSEFIRLKIVPFLTKIQLKINGIHYNQLKLVQNESEKLEFIKKIKPTFVLDDQVSLLEKVPESTQSICVATPHNEKIDISDNIIRVSSYKNNEVNVLIEERSKIKNKQPKKYVNVKFYERAFTESFYVLTRSLGKNIFINKFQPIVHGVENIPNDKRSVVYVGNHRNNFDPLILTLFIEQPTHWAALLRLFEAKENLFGRDDIYLLRKLSSLLVKSMGAIPIARPVDENYKKINVNSLLKIDEYIKLGSSIGFYPEGTINRKPEEINILPLASDAIFSIIKRNNSWLQPFSIVWTPKDINIQNKVVLTFSDPIEPTGMNTQEIKNLWEQSVNDSIEKTKVLFDQLRIIETDDTNNKEIEKQLIIKKFMK